MLVNNTMDTSVKPKLLMLAKLKFKLKFTNML